MCDANNSLYLLYYTWEDAWGGAADGQSQLVHTQTSLEDL